MSFCCRVRSAIQPSLLSISKFVRVSVHSFRFCWLAFCAKIPQNIEKRCKRPEMIVVWYCLWSAGSLKLGQMYVAIVQGVLNGGNHKVVARIGEELGRIQFNRDISIVWYKKTCDNCLYVVPGFFRV